MNVIPVLDLKDGCVAHAKQGNRARYQPIQSALTSASEPISVVQAFLSLYPFKRLYIADIDAIQKVGNHASIITNILAGFPALEIWLDAGLTTTDEINQWRNAKVRIVLGSESLDSIETYQHLLSACETAPVLSLDFKSGSFLGPQDLLTSPEHWTHDVIIMTLDQVGSQAGPDFEQLKRIKELSSSRSIYAAGGIRSAHDLVNLKDQGVAGGLLASALHSGAISRDDLEKLQA